MDELLRNDAFESDDKLEGEYAKTILCYVHIIIIFSTSTPISSHTFNNKSFEILG